MPFFRRPVAIATFFQKNGDFVAKVAARSAFCGCVAWKKLLSME
jgi:hypothetical protein